MILGALAYKLGMDASKFEAGMRGAQKALRRFAGAVAETTSIIASFATAAVGIYGTAMVKKQMEQITLLTQYADRLGIATEALTGLQYAAGAYGVEAEDMTDALKDLSEKIADAAIAGGTYDETLKRMGLSSKELVHLPIDQQFFRVADAIGNMSTQGEKAFASMELMSDVGFKLVNAMDAGSDSIRQLMGEAKDLGLVFDRRASRAVQMANESWLKLNAAMNGFWRRIAPEVAIVLTVITEKLSAMLTGGDKTVSGLTRGFGTFAYAIAEWMDWFSRMGNSMSYAWAKLKFRILDIAKAAVETLAIVEQTGLDLGLTASAASLNKQLVELDAQLAEFEEREYRLKMGLEGSAQEAVRNQLRQIEKDIASAATRAQEKSSQSATANTRLFLAEFKKGLKDVWKDLGGTKGTFARLGKTLYQTTYGSMSKAVGDAVSKVKAAVSGGSATVTAGITSVTGSFNASGVTRSAAVRQNDRQIELAEDQLSVLRSINRNLDVVGRAL